MNTVDLVARLRRLGTDLTQVEVKSAAGGLPKDVVESLSAIRERGRRDSAPRALRNRRFHAGARLQRQSDA